MLPEIQLSEIQEKAKQEDPMEFLFFFYKCLYRLRTTRG